MTGRGTTDEPIQVLHVDDDPSFVEVAATFLERADDRFVVETATRVTDALERLETTQVDCLVSDYDMPETSGLAFLEAVRAEHADLPFIFYTGKGSEEIASEAISAGVTDYLQKASGTDQYTILANRIRNAVERARVERERQRINERMQLALEETEAIIFELDFDTGAVSRHGAVDTFFDVDPDRLQTNAEYTERVVHPEDRDRYQAFYERLATNAPDDDVIEYRVITDTETVRWLRDHAYVEAGPEGRSRAVGLARDVTDRKQREKELERYEAYLERSTDIISVLDESGTIEYESPSIARILGYDPGQLIGRNGFEFIHPDDRDDVWETFSELVAEPGGTDVIECRFQTADGEWRWLEIHGTNQLDNPAIEGIVANSRDITERKREERERSKIVERVTDAIVEVDADWTFTLVNEQAEELYGLEAPKLLGRSFWDVFENARGPPFEAEYRSVMEDREPTSFTAFHSELNGWFDVEAYPNDNGGIAFYFRKVTDRVERSTELERRSERFEYVETMGDIGYWELDPTTPEPHEVTLSDGLYRLHGLSPDEKFDAERGLEFVHPDDRPTMERAVCRAIEHGEPYEHEVRMITTAGHQRWVQTAAEPIEEDGEVVLVRGVFQDVTDRREQEAELARKNDRLDEFAGAVSHDLRTPLAVAEGSIELAREECDSQSLDRAAEAIERSQGLIEDILRLAREGGAGELESVALEDVLERAWEAVPTATASLSHDLNRTVEADPDRVQRLFENLIRNAVDHGGEEVNVTVGETTDGFFVADDGPGIPAEDRERVFEVGHSTEEGGTGYGLAIVERIAAAHDWVVTATESECGGTRIEISGVRAD